MVRRGEAVTLGQEVYEQLRRDVLTGRLRPGQRLQPGELRTHYRVSVGVMREALTRLAENHLVVVAPNAGFRVADLTPEEITDLTRVRCTVEGLALRMAIERGDLDWRSQVVAAHYRLVNTPPMAPDDLAVPTAAWTDAHTAFHRTLVDACRVPPLLDMCAAISDAIALYRNSTIAAAGDDAGERRTTAEAEHQQIVDAVLAGDADRATSLLTVHFRGTARAFIDAHVPG